MAKYVTREQHLDFLHRFHDDSGLMYRAASIFDTTSHNLIRSAMFICDGYHCDVELDQMFMNIHRSIGKVEARYRQYLIDIIMGDQIFISDIQSKTAVIRA